MSYFSEKKETFSSSRARLSILDFGSGTGEFTVLMNLLGHNATGVELHSTHLRLARTLARENELPDSIFVHNAEKRLPFPDNTFDLVTSFSVVEHLDAATLAWVLPEFHRVCRGEVFTLVPNPLKPIDDHTGNKFLGFMPRRVALIYLKLVGEKYEYSKITQSGDWDVYYRFLPKLKKCFERGNFSFGCLPDSLHYPPLTACKPIDGISKSFKLFGYRFSLKIPFPVTLMLAAGVEKQFFYPYLNLVCKPKKSSTL